MTDNTGDERFPASLSKPISVDLTGFALQLQQGNASSIDAKSHAKHGEKSKPVDTEKKSLGVKKDVPSDGADALGAGDSALFVSMMSPTDHLSQPPQSGSGSEQAYLPDMKLFGDGAHQQALTNRGDSPDVKSQLNSATPNPPENGNLLPSMLIGAGAQTLNSDSGNATTLVQSDAQLLASLQAGSPNAASTPAGATVAADKSAAEKPAADKSIGSNPFTLALAQNDQLLLSSLQQVPNQATANNDVVHPAIVVQQAPALGSSAGNFFQQASFSPEATQTSALQPTNFQPGNLSTPSLQLTVLKAQDSKTDSTEKAKGAINSGADNLYNAGTINQTLIAAGFVVPQAVQVAPGDQPVQNTVKGGHLETPSVIADLKEAPQVVSSPLPQIVKSSNLGDTTNATVLVSSDQNLLASLQQPHPQAQTLDSKSPSQPLVQNVLAGTQSPFVSTDVVSKGHDIGTGGNATYSAESVTQTLTAAGFVAPKPVANVDGLTTVADSNSATIVSRNPIVLANADVLTADDVQRLSKAKTSNDLSTPTATSISTFDSQLLASMQPHTELAPAPQTPLKPSVTPDNFLPLQTVSAAEAPKAKESFLNTNNYNSDSVTTTLAAAGFIPSPAVTGNSGNTRNLESDNAVAVVAETGKNPLVLASASNSDVRDVQSIKSSVIVGNSAISETGTPAFLSSYDSQLLAGLQQQAHSDVTTSDRNITGKPPVVPMEIASNSVQQQHANYFDNASSLKESFPVTTYKADSVTETLVAAGFIPAQVAANAGTSSTPTEVVKTALLASGEQAKSTTGLSSVLYQTNVASSELPNGNTASVKTISDLTQKQDLADVQPARNNTLSSQVASLLANLDASATPVKPEQSFVKTDLTSVATTDAVAITSGIAPASQLFPSAVQPSLQTTMQTADVNTQTKTNLIDSFKATSAITLADVALVPTNKTSLKSLSDKNGQPEFRYVGPGTSVALETSSASQATLAAMSLRNVFARQSTHMENNGDIATAGLQALLSQTKSVQSTTIESSLNASALSGIQKSVLVLNPSTVVSGVLLPSDGKVSVPVSLSVVFPTGITAVQNEQLINSTADAGLKGKLIPLVTSVLQAEDIQSPRAVANVGFAALVPTTMTVTGKGSNEIAGTSKGLEPIAHPLTLNESGDRAGANGVLISRTPLTNTEGKGVPLPGRLPINESLPPELTEIASSVKSTGTIGGALSTRPEFVEEGATKKQTEVVPANLPVMNNILVVPPKIGGKGSETVEEIDAQVPAARTGISGGGSVGTTNPDPSNTASVITTATPTDPNSTHGNAASTAQDLVDQLPHLVIVDKNNVAVANNSDESNRLEPTRADMQNSDTSAVGAPRGDIDNLDPHNANECNTADDSNALIEPSPRYNNDENENSYADARTDCDSLYPDKNLTDETIRISGIATKNHVEILGTEDDVKDFVNNLEERRLYQIRKNDTLSSIAKNMLGSTRYIPLLIELNRGSIRLKADGTVELRPGTYIMLPSHSDMMKFVSMGEDVKAIYAEAAQAQTGDVRETYACRYGDTLKTVARRHPALRDARVWTLLAQLNNLSCRQNDKKLPLEKLRRGQILVIPNAAEKLEFLQQLPSNVTPKPLKGSIFSNENRVRATTNDSAWPDYDDSHTTVTGDKTVVTVDRTQVAGGGTKASTESTEVSNDSTRITSQSLGDEKPVRGRAWIQESKK